jgi:glutathione peroxidase
MTLSRRFILGSLCAAAALPASAGGNSPLPRVSFVNADGGMHDSADWVGHPVLVINSASRCGFTPQYDAMQAVYDAYAERGLIVLAVPSDDFRQELSSIDEVKEFCELNFNLTLPMTDITHVKGPEAHPFYQWLAADHGFVPQWNFNKVLIGADGLVKGTWGSTTKPDNRQILDLIEAELTT